MRFRHLAGPVAVSISATAPAQSTGSSVVFPSGWAPGQSPCVKQSDGTCAPVSATTQLGVFPYEVALAGVAFDVLALPASYTLSPSEAP
jgi:hypothetical protein